MIAIMLPGNKWNSNPQHVVWMMLYILVFAQRFHSVVANSTFFDVPVVPYVLPAVGENGSSVLVTLQAVNTVPNLVDVSSDPPRALTAFTQEQHSGLQMAAPLASTDGRTIFVAVSYG